MRPIKKIIVIVLIYGLFINQLYATSLSCPRIWNESFLRDYTNVTTYFNKNGEPTFLSRVSVMDRNGLPEFDPGIDEKRIEIISTLNRLIEKRIRLKGFKKFLTHYYMIHDSREKNNGIFKTDLKKLAKRSVYYFCQSGCQKYLSVGKLLRVAEHHIKKLQDDNVARYSLSEIKDLLEINYMGLNSILNHHKKNRKLGIENYSTHLRELSYSFPDSLMLTKALMKSQGKLVDSKRNYKLHKKIVTKSNLKKAIREYFHSQSRIWKNFDHESLIEQKWYDWLSLYSFEANMAGAYDLKMNTQPLLLLKYFISAPLVVAEVIKENKDFEKHLCWIVEHLDRHLSQIMITNSVVSFSSFLMPFSIALLFFVSPVSAPLWGIGLIALNVVTAIDLFKRAGDNDKLRTEIEFLERNLNLGLGNNHSKSVVQEKWKKFYKERFLFRSILILELVGTGMVVKSVLNTRKAYAKLSDDKMFNKLKKHTQRTNHSMSKRTQILAQRARYEINDKVRNVISKHGKDYHSFMNGTRNMGHKFSLDELDLLFFVKHAPKEELRKLLLKHPHVGLRSSTHKTELTFEALEQVFVHLNLPLAENLKSFEFLLLAFDTELILR